MKSSANGQMDQIVRCDWLPEQVYLGHLGFRKSVVL